MAGFWMTAYAYLHETQNSSTTLLLPTLRPEQCF